MNVIAGCEEYVIAGCEGYVIAGCERYVIAGCEGYVRAGCERYIFPLSVQKPGLNPGLGGRWNTAREHRIHYATGTTGSWLH